MYPNLTVSVEKKINVWDNFCRPDTCNVVQTNSRPNLGNLPDVNKIKKKRSPSRSIKVLMKRCNVKSPFRCECEARRNHDGLERTVVRVSFAVGENNTRVLLLTTLLGKYFTSLRRNLKLYATVTMVVCRLYGGYAVINIFVTIPVRSKTFMDNSFSRAIIITIIQRCICFYQNTANIKIIYDRTEALP